MPEVTGRDRRISVAPGKASRRPTGGRWRILSHGSAGAASARKSVAPALEEWEAECGMRNVHSGPAWLEGLWTFWSNINAYKSIVL